MLIKVKWNLILFLHLHQNEINLQLNQQNQSEICMSNQSDAQVKPDFVPPPPLIRICESQEIKKPQK